jgi:hypothetical protein
MVGVMKTTLSYIVRVFFAVLRCRNNFARCRVWYIGPNNKLWKALKLVVLL